MEDSLCHLDPTELASVESGFCTTSLIARNLKRSAEALNHRGKLGGVLTDQDERYGTRDEHGMKHAVSQIH